MRRHIHFGMVGDLLDIQKHDWPTIKDTLGADLYGQHDPVPVEVADLGEMAAKANGITGQGWYNDNGEIGDICAWKTRTLGKYTIQLEWSNQAGPGQ